jgi:hypothetical protein
MYLARAVLALGLLALLGACQPPPPRQPLDREALQQQLRALASVAAEGGLLARQLAQDRVAGSFAWVEQQGLGDDAARAAAEVARPAGANLAAAQHDALQLAATLQLELTRVATVRNDAAALGALEERFTGLRAQAQRLEKGL